MPVSGSTVPNHILRDIDTINGMELTNMMSVHTATFWYRLSIPRGTASRCVTEFRLPLQVQSHLEMPGILVQLGHIQHT